VDVGGLVLSVAGVSAVVYTVIEASGWGWGSVRTVAGFAVGIAVLAQFAVWEGRQAHPMLDLRVFSNRRFSGGSLAVTAGFLTLFGFIFVITQYFQFVKAYTAFETGVRMLPVAVSIALASVIGPRLAGRVGTTGVVAGGLAVFAGGLAWTSTVSAATSYGEIAAQMVLLGAGLGFTTSPATESIMGSLSVDRAGVGSAVNDTTRELGGTLGVAVIGSVFASIYASRLANLDVIASLSASARASAGRSLAAAYQVAGSLPPPRARSVVAAANSAFLDGFQVACLVCAGIAVLAAVAVMRLLPARAASASEPIAVEERPRSLEAA
jgi:predicted MFS family arabinose efflux permease